MAKDGLRPRFKEFRLGADPETSLMSATIPTCMHAVYQQPDAYQRRQAWPRQFVAAASADGVHFLIEVFAAFHALAHVHAHAPHVISTAPRSQSAACETRWVLASFRE